MTARRHASAESVRRSHLTGRIAGALHRGGPVDARHGERHDYRSIRRRPARRHRHAHQLGDRRGAHGRDRRRGRVQPAQRRRRHATCWSSACRGFADATRNVELLARQIVRADTAAADRRREREGRGHRRPAGDRARARHDRQLHLGRRTSAGWRSTSAPPTTPARSSSPRWRRASSRTRSGQISLAGAMPFMTSFSVDGISTQRVRYGGPSSELFPSVESIAEFKVTSANSNAEFMQATDLTTTSRSGTNQLHGTAFWFNQNSALSATTAVHAARRRRQPDQAGHRGQQLRPLRRRPDRPQPRLLLRHLRGRPPAERGHAQPGGPARRVARRRPVERRRPDPQSRHRAAVRQQPDSRQPDFGEDPRVVLRAPEPVHRRRHQRAELHRQRAWRLHRQRLRRPRRRGADEQPEGVRAAHVEERGRQEPERRRLEHDAGRPLQAHRGAADRRRRTTGCTARSSTSCAAAGRTPWRRTATRTPPQGADLVQQVGLVGLAGPPATGGFPHFEFEDGSFISTGGVKPFDILSRVVQGSDTVDLDTRPAHDQGRRRPPVRRVQGSDLVLRRRGARAVRVRRRLHRQCLRATSSSGCRTSPATSCPRPT